MTFNSRLIVFVAILASLLEIIDTSIVNVAIPTMMGNLGCTLDEISVVITAYTVANAIVLPISAWLGQRFGLRQYYLSCIALFTIASVACGLSVNLMSLVICRIFQGLAGGALLPTSQALIYQQFPKEKAGMAGAIFGMSVMIGPTLGPVIGGYLTDNYGWRSIFNVNLPLGIVTLFIGMICIKNNEENIAITRSKLDIVGLTLLVLGIGFLQYYLERGQAEDWFNSHLIIFSMIVSTITLVLFIWWERKVVSPIINIFLFKNKLVVCGICLMSCLGFYLYGVVFSLPVFVQKVFQFTPTQTGIIFIPGSILTALLMPFVGKSLSYVPDARILIFIGLFFVEISLYFITLFSSLTTYEFMLITLFIRGFALAFLFVPINSVILSQFTGYEMGQVAGLLNLFRQVGGSLGIAVINTLFTRNLDKNYHHLIEKVSILNPNVQNEYFPSISDMMQKMTHNLGFTDFTNPTLQNLYHRVHTQAFILGFNDTIFIMACAFSVSFIPLYFLNVKKNMDPPVKPRDDGHLVI